MGTHRQILGGLAALVACLALVACGDVGKPTAPGTLEIASLPAAEVFVDGTSHGTTPVTIEIAAGAHDVKLQREYFTTFETKVDVGSGQASGVEGVLKPYDPTDAEALAIIAESYKDADDEVAFEVYEEPKRHRGPSKAVLARLLWPQDEIRAQGLKTFCLEATLDYMGDGYLTFKKGRKVLYREPFEPDYEVTVAEIPAVVRDALKTNDSVTWGITFDDRRKPVTTKFKVVKRPKVEKKLAKLEKDRNFARLDAASQDLLRADVLLRYRLYSEALVEHLNIHQANPTSMAPYQGIVKALRRLDDGDETNLWLAVLPETGGGGRYARKPVRQQGAPAAAGTTVPQPGVPGPEAPGSSGGEPSARPEPADAGGASRPLRPGDQAPASHLALWTPAAGARPEEAPTVPTTDPAIVAPTPSGEPVKPGTGDAVSERGLRLKVDQTTKEFLAARADANAAALELQEAQEGARDAEEKTNVAIGEARRAQENAEKAAELAQTDPSAEHDRMRDEADVAAAEAHRKADEADLAAQEARKRLDRVDEKSREAAKHADVMAKAMENARSEAEANGVAVAPLSPDRPEDGTRGDLLPQAADEREAAIDAAQKAATARQKYEALRMAADRTGDDELKGELEQALEELQAAEKLADQTLTAYQRAGGEPVIPEIEGLQASSTPEEGMKAVLAGRVEVAKAGFEEAQRELAQAQEARAENPTEPAAEDSIRVAEAKVAAAEDHLSRVTRQYEEHGGD